MHNLIREAMPLVAMILVTIVLITCIANDIDHGTVYAGITVVSGLGGYSVGRKKNDRERPKE